MADDEIKIIKDTEISGAVIKDCIIMCSNIEQCCVSEVFMGHSTIAGTLTIGAAQEPNNLREQAIKLLHDPDFDEELMIQAVMSFLECKPKEPK